MVKFDVLQVRKYAKICISELRDHGAGKRFEKFKGLHAEIVGMDKLKPLVMRLRFDDGFSGKVDKKLPNISTQFNVFFCFICNKALTVEFIETH